jgi:hypothetical protein
VIIAHPVVGRETDQPLSVTRAQADAFHIATFAVVEAVYDVFFRGSRDEGAPDDARPTAGP